MILVTGATGQLARLVIEHLLKSVPSNQIVAAVRNVEKAEDLKSRGIIVREADYDQPEQWYSALEGVEKVLLISGPEVGGRVKQHKAVIDAIKQTGSVKLVAYTSILRADTSQVSYASEDRETEKMIREIGVPFVFLRHGWYIENYTMNAEYAVKEGVLYGCASTGKISGASRADYAEAAATVLTTTAELKEIYELAGDMSFTLQDVALDMSWQSGKTVTYLDMSEDEYRTLLIDFGLPEGLASTLAIADTGVANGDVYSESRDLSDLIGRGTTHLSAVLEEALSRMGNEGSSGR
ncbi:NAD(P)H dehydrogenase (quinone) [Pseudomonas cedrina]|uniref:NAD(P)-dependent oxidoreductase n=2 Tax=Pseudomonas cedrina TaxID=651740 RepID=A0A1V2JWC1_PSECE|nr:SDR family oxidoreductase [Pseudomonas cedrina]ONH49738.1 NAD(P)-dependent oxidoreductase [Pseudomonas cedrina subsp. cedrina]SDT07716.1 NAD(P)H dehydrogenase (quinone) [Pseudomonas cedrina]